jgi:hypothetical protein
VFRNSLVTYMSSAQEQEYSLIGFTSLLRLTNILDEEHMEPWNVQNCARCINNKDFSTGFRNRSRQPSMWLGGF